MAIRSNEYEMFYCSISTLSPVWSTPSPSNMILQIQMAQELTRGITHEVPTYFT